MEPQPPTSADGVGSKWWTWNHGPHPANLTLNTLWEVEERLIQEKHDSSAIREAFAEYAWTISWHATPEQKIKALAAVLEPLVKTAPAPASLVVQLCGPLCPHCYKPKMNCDCD